MENLVERVSGRSLSRRGFVAGSAALAGAFAGFSLQACSPGAGDGAADAGGQTDDEERGLPPHAGTTAAAAA